MLKKILLTLIALLVIITVGIYGFLLSSKKSYSDTINLKGLKEEVSITFDTYGIPHIKAKNNEDAFRALGYVHASDRLFQMELLRHVGGGALSELFGDKLIETDKFLRTLGLDYEARNAAMTFEQNGSELQKQLVKAYIEGINQFIEEGETPVEYTVLGIEKKPFTTTDMYRILGFMGFSFTLELKTEPLLDWIAQNYGYRYVAELSPDYSPLDFTIPVYEKPNDTLSDITSLSEKMDRVHDNIPVPLFYGSNSWVIGPKKTKSGKVLFANDTHIAFSQPSVWYEAHIETPDLQLYGNFMAGVPFPLVGHTDHHAWGLTIFPADEMDLFREKIKDDKVMYKNAWVPLEKRTEKLTVKGGVPVEFEVLTTPHGPIVTDLKGVKNNVEHPVALWWVANHNTDKKLQAVFTFSFSDKMEEVASACELMSTPGLNVMYGDKEGNIAWWGTSKLVKRPAHVNAHLILEGWSGKDEPEGYYPFSDNPKSINPPAQYVVSANNQPDSVKGVFYPGYYYAGSRAYMISSALSAKDDWTVADMQKLVMNNTSPWYPANAKEILSAIEPKTDLEKEAVKILTTWDGQHQPNSIAPVLYYKLIYHVLHLTLADEMGEERFKLYTSTPYYLRAIRPLLKNDSSVWWDNVTTEEKESRTAIFEQAFTTGIAELTAQLGNDIEKWLWKDVLVFEHPHPLGKQAPLDKVFNVGPFTTGGGEEVINKMSFKLNPSGVYHVRSGPAMRILIDFADVPHSLSINPTGESGNLMDPHYDDQAEMFANGQFRMQLMDWNDIEKRATGTWTMVP